MKNPSAKFQLIEDRLGSDLAAFIHDKRDDEVSCENIARELWLTTGVNVTAQTIANWEAAHSHSPTEAAS